MSARSMSFLLAIIAGLGLALAAEPNDWVSRDRMFHRLEAFGNSVIRKLGIPTSRPQAETIRKDDRHGNQPEPRSDQLVSERDAERSVPILTGH